MHDGKENSKNLVCKHRNEISKEIQRRLKAKVKQFKNMFTLVFFFLLFGQAEATRKKIIEKRFYKQKEAERKADQELQKKAEKEVMEKMAQNGADVNGAFIDWDIVQI